MSTPEEQGMTDTTLTPEDVVALARVSDARISPDGRWIVYQAGRGLVEENLWSTDLWLVPVDQTAEPRQLTHEPPTVNRGGGLAFEWLADSTGVLYATSAAPREVVRINLDGSVEAVPGTESLVPEGWQLGRVLVSPDGRFLAFTRMAPPVPARSMSLRGLQLDPFTGPVFPMPAVRAGRLELAVLDLQNKVVTTLTDESLTVSAFAWSPDSERLVVIADPARPADHVASMSDHDYARTHAFVIDRQKGAARPLVQTAGRKLNPAWSPDGRWVSYISDVDGFDPMPHTLPAVVDVETGELSYLGRREREVVGAVFTDLVWSEDSQWVYVEANSRMRRQLFRARVPQGEFEQVSPDDDVTLGRLSRAGDTMAYLRLSVDEPGDVFVADLGEFRPRQVTSVNATRDRAVEPIARQITYRSGDDTWDIDATVLLPPDYEEGKRYPLIVELMGGPGAVPLTYDLAHHYPTRVQASRGYVVLRPNTRGRAQMGGLSIASAIKTERSQLANPWTDVIVGVDLLIEQGIVDADRMGVCGASYGAFLTAYGMTQTDRFGAASFHEGPSDTLSFSLRSPHPDRLAGSGIGDLTDPAEYDRVRLESPLQNAYRVSTPCLIEVGGESSLLADHGAMMARALVGRGVPCDFVAYPRSGHGIDEVALLLDAQQRHLAWFDYWLLDQPTPGWDLSRFDGWKSAR